jgi:hypothetical protein
MATTHQILLDVPTDLFARIADAAARADRPVETILVDTLALLFNAPAIDVDWEHVAETLGSLSDAELWALAHRRAAWTAATRLRDLTARGKQAPLLDEEQTELADLIDEADRIMELRSHVLRLLQQRGHDVRNYLPLGA